jgi:hypothetical protein
MRALASPIFFVPDYTPVRQGKSQDSVPFLMCDLVWAISCFQQVIAENQLFAATALANVTAQPATMIIIRAKIMYLSFISAKKRSIKRKYIPKTAIINARIAAITMTEHKRPQAGWI